MKILYVILFGLALLTAGAQAQLFEYVTAKELLPGAVDKARTDFADDAFLVNVLFARISVSGVSPDMKKEGTDAGKSTAWVYRFYSPNLTENYFLAGVKNVALGAFYVAPSPGSLPALPFERDAKLVEPYIDSPDALEAEKAAGADDYLTQHPNAEILTAALLYNPFETPIAPEGKFWVMQFGAEGSDTLTCAVYAEDGTALECGVLVSVEGISKAKGFRLDQNYPNPYSLSSGRSAVIRFAIAERQNIRLELYTILGKKITSLYSGTQNPGEYRAVVGKDAFPSAGMYFYRLETDRGNEVRRMIVVK